MPPMPETFRPDRARRSTLHRVWLDGPSDEKTQAPAQERSWASWLRRLRGALRSDAEHHAAVGADVQRSATQTTNAQPAERVARADQASGQEGRTTLARLARGRDRR